MRNCTPWKQSEAHPGLEESLTQPRTPGSLAASTKLCAERPAPLAPHARTRREDIQDTRFKGESTKTNTRSLSLPFCLSTALEISTAHFMGA